MKQGTILSLEQYQDTANAAMHSVLSALVKNGTISVDVATEFLDTHVVIVATPGGSLRRWFSRWFKDTKCEAGEIVTKVLTVKTYQ